MKPFLFTLAVPLLSLSLLHAQSATMSHQGYLESAGAPVDSPQNLTFSLHTALAGGTQVWTETQNAVLVTDGIYNVELGSVTSLEGVDFNVDLWLEVMVDATALSPRTKLAGVPYAHTLQVPAEMEGAHSMAVFEATNTSSTVFSSGIRGVSSATSGLTYGVLGENTSTNGHGVHGLAATPSGAAYGVYGRSISTSGIGIYGETTATSGVTRGVYGASSSPNGRGISGFATATSGVTFGVQGDVFSPDGYAGYFAGGNGVYTLGADNDKPDLILGGTTTGQNAGRIFSDPNYEDGDIWLQSNDAVIVVLNNDNAGQTDSDFIIESFDRTQIFNVDEDGTVTITNDVIVDGTTVHTSDRNRKEGFETVDVEQVLREVVRLPVMRWRYQGQAAAHLGPMAQDFHAAFGLGQDETTIAAVDADGVALAAIQGLHRQLRQKDKEIALLTQRLEALEALMAERAR